MSRPRLSAPLVAAVAAALLVAYAVVWVGVSAAEAARSDFTATYVGASLLRAGKGASMYDGGVQAHVQAAAIAPQVTGNLPWVNPPTAAVLALPATLLAFPAAYRAWQVAQLLMLAGAVLLVARAAPWPRRLRGTVVVPAAALAALAGVGTLSLGLLGQWDGLSALGLAGAYVLWRRNALFAGGLVLAVTASSVKPHLALGLAALLLGWRERRALGGAAVGLGLAVAVSLAVAGPAGLGGFLTAVRADATLWPLASMLGFTGLTASWLGDGASAQLVAAVLSIAALAACVWLGAQLRADRGRLEWCLAGATVLSLLASPHMLGQDLALLAPTLVWTLAAAAADDAPDNSWPGPRSQSVLAFWATLAGAAAIDIGASAGAPPGRIVPLVLGAGAVALVVLLRRRRVRSPASPAGSVAGLTTARS